MIDPTVRPAVVTDLGQLDELAREAREALESQRGGPRWLEDHPPWVGAWNESDPSRRVIVAHIDEVVVGYCLAHHESDLVVVDEIYVTPEAREVGFGDALLGAAIAEARRTGIGRLDASALPGDRSTKNLYERAGIKARLIVVSATI